MRNVRDGHASAISAPANDAPVTDAAVSLSTEEDTAVAGQVAAIDVEGDTLSFTVPLAYTDVRCAIRWVHAHAGDYGIDPERVYLIGQSAGGHMVSLAATIGARFSRAMCRRKGRSSKVRKG